MTKLEFRQHNPFNIGIWDDAHVASIKSPDSLLKWALGSVYRHLTADELEQIAAKLRELNGEPNTRALDERVKELREKVSQLKKDYPKAQLAMLGVEWEINEIFGKERS